MLSRADFYLVLVGFQAGSGTNSHEVIIGKVEIEEDGAKITGDGIFLRSECRIDGEIEGDCLTIRIAVRSKTEKDRENWIFFGSKFAVKAKIYSRPYVGVFGKWNIVDDEVGRQVKRCQINSAGSAICSMHNPS